MRRVIATRTSHAAAAALIAFAVLVLLGAGAGRSSADSSSGCGGATQAAVQNVYTTSMQAIYEGELRGAEVKQDARRVRGSMALAQALAAGDTAGVLSATHALVYHRGWHIVRLRVLSTAGQVLADVGGPYVLAPVIGQIREAGKTVGSYVMSVQDDLGYAKLVTRFTGLPIAIYLNGQPVVSRVFTSADVPPTIPADGARLTVGGVSSIAVTYRVSAFPQGKADVLLAIPRAGAKLAARSCLAVNALIYTSVASHLAGLLNLPAGAGTFAGIDHEFDPNKLVVVREGDEQLVGPQDLSGQSLPPRGSMSYDGQQWLVTSFAPVSGVTVYLLFPLGVPATGATGATGVSGSS